MIAVGKKILAVSGGVGGAKLALGLYDALPPQSLDVLVNTGDDFEHLGLHISPDVDTLLYTLGGLADPVRGWGLADESWQAMDALSVIGGDTWFRLGDRDLATHLWRTQQLAAGRSLTEVTADLARAFGIDARVLPMSDNAVRTTVHTPEGPLPFQHYFVKAQCEPVVTGFTFEGLQDAAPSASAMQALAADDYAAVIICPSNPFVSVDPVLQVPGLWQALRDNSAPVVVVSPIVGGAAIKGPAAKMMAELAVPVTAQAVAQHYLVRYPGLIDCFVLDETDATLAPSVEDLGVATFVTNTLMTTRSDKLALAERLLRQVAG